MLESLQTESDLLQHDQIGTREKRNECNECGKTFSLKQNLIEHKQMHPGEKSHECTECGKVFSRVSSLTLHLRSHIGNTGNNIVITMYNVGWVLD